MIRVRHPKNARGQAQVYTRIPRNARARASYTRNSGPLKGALIIYAGLQGPLCIEIPEGISF